MNPEKLVKKKKLTLRDIAKSAKVSHTTVSRALNDDPRVRAETKERVLRLVKQLSYKPDARARNLVLRKSNLIGLEVPDISVPFCAELARGIEDKAYQENYSVIFCSTDNKPGRMEASVNLMTSVGVDGFIFTSARLHEPIVEKLIDEKLPLVLINRKLRGEHFNYIVLDNVKGAYEITKHLIDLGYEKIAIIDGPLNVSTGLDRMRGYQRALRDNNIDANQEYIINGPWSRATGYKGAEQLLKLKNRPEAIFGASDQIALGVIDAVEERGLTVPDDISLVGFDDTDFASNQRIKLTTVSQRKYEMGNLGVQILIDYIERKETDYTHKVVLEPRLIIRESCGIKLRKKSKNIEAISSNG